MYKFRLLITVQRRRERCAVTVTSALSLFNVQRLL